MKKLYLFLPMLLLAISCGVENAVVTLHSTNSTASACRGFSINSLPVAIGMDTNLYCLAERVFWSYDNQKLKILHAQFGAYCSAKLAMTATAVGSIITVSHADTSSGPRTTCICPFDMYCEIQGTFSSTVTMKVLGASKGDVSFSLDPSKQQGVYVVNDTLPWITVLP